MSNRRSFVAAAAGGALLGPVATAPATAASAWPARRLGGSPTYAVFRALQGEDFRVFGAAGRASARLRLIAAHERSAQQRLEQFTLVLRGEDATVLQSGLYRVAHPVAGRFQVRLEPSGHDQGAPLYRADFSLMV